MTESIWVIGGFVWPLALLLAAVLAGLRRVKPPMLGWSLAWFLATFVFLRFGFAVPIPGSVLTIYMMITLGAIFAYASSSRERLEGTVGPIRRLILDPGKRLQLAGLILLIPALVALNVYASMSVPVEAPLFGRTVHPAPPDSITIHENTIDLVAGDNPFREMATADPEAFQAHLENGRRVYFQNCFYCHGDTMAGDGMFNHGLNPIPTDFSDPGVLPMFQETFLFWRVSKGGPGLPEEGGPWDSAMPRWEQFLTEEEMWDAVAYLFEYTGYEPRKQEVHH
jgi:mono/diheme cytochrome c family protein